MNTKHLNMKNGLLIFATLYFMLLPFVGSTQKDTILMLNGVEHIGEIVDKSQYDVTIRVTKTALQSKLVNLGIQEDILKEKLYKAITDKETQKLEAKLAKVANKKQRIETSKKETDLKIEQYRIFSVTQNAQKQLVYTYDTAIGNYLTVEQMALYVQGQKDAWVYYEPRFVDFVTGAAAVAGVVLNNKFFVLLAPFAVGSMGLLPPIKINKEQLPNAALLSDLNYLEGFLRVAKTKRRNKMLLSSITGTVAGVVGFIILDQMGSIVKS